jgi:hypothetical protein
VGEATPSGGIDNLDEGYVFISYSRDDADYVTQLARHSARTGRPSWLTGLCWARSGRTLYAAGAFGLYRFDLTDP